MDQDIRWHQRFANYNKALDQLEEAVSLTRVRSLSKLEQLGLVKAFEYTYELAWNVMKDFLEYQGKKNIIGSRDVFREAFQDGLIENGEVWMGMIVSRNKTSHIYNEETADEIAEIIAEVYYDKFQELKYKFESLRSGEQKELFQS